MNKAALIKHEIYGKLIGLSGPELNSVADFIDFVQHKKQQPLKKKNIKLQGILANYNFDFADFIVNVAKVEVNKQPNYL